MFLDQLELIGVPKEHISARDIIIEEGKPGTSCYVLIDGEVAVNIKDQEIAKVSQPGAIVGEMSALLGGSRRATVYATRDSEFYVIDDLMSFLKEHREIAVLMLKNMAERVDSTNTMLTDKHWWQVW